MSSTASTSSTSKKKALPWIPWKTKARLCLGRNQYAKWNRDCSDGNAAMSEMDDAMEQDVEQRHLDFDNTKSDADFDAVSDEKYTPAKGWLGGDIAIYEHIKFEKHPMLVGYADRTGTYRYKSARGVEAYPGWEGRARILAFPQCKFMNSLVFDDYAEHKVAVFDNSQMDSDYVPYLLHCYDGKAGELPVYTGTGRNRRFSPIDKDGDSRLEFLTQSPFGSNCMHVPFDAFIFIGVVFGKILHVRRRFCKGRNGDLPAGIYVQVSEVFETLNPGHRWSAVSDDVREMYRQWCEGCADKLHRAGLLFDMPEGNSRKTHVWRSMLDNCPVYRKYGDKFILHGFKVFLSRSPMVEFCFGNGLKNPRVVQIPVGMLDIRKDFGRKSTSWALENAYVTWLVSYRNYWLKRGKAFRTCVPQVTQTEMRKAFNGSDYDISTLKTRDMKKMLDRLTVAYHEDHPGLKWNALMDGYKQIGNRCRFEWRLIQDIRRENVYAKDADGNTYSISDVDGGDAPDMVEAWNDIEEINNENRQHRVEIGRKRIRTDMSAVARVQRNASGVLEVKQGEYMRNYTHLNGFQGMKSSERHEIKIDGLSTVELDFSSLHPTMMYAMCGVDAHSQDLYDFGKWYVPYGLSAEDARAICKSSTLVYTNASNRGRALNSFKGEWNVSHGRPKKAYLPWMMDMERAMFARHSGISGMFCSGIGTKLQYMDGKMMRRICRRLTGMGICALPIHDSVIVQKRYAAVCKGIMLEEYARMFSGTGKFSIRIKEK